MGRRLAIFIAILVTVVWVACGIFVNNQTLLLAEPLISPERFTRAGLIVLPALLGLAFLIMASLELSLREQARRTQQQIKKLRSQLNGPQAKSREDDGIIADPAVRTLPDIDPTPGEKDAHAEAPESAEGGGRADADGVPGMILVRALNFAESEDDVEGLEAVDRASRDPEMEKVLDAALAVLELLASTGIAIEDAPVDFAPPDAWRRVGQSRRRNQVTTLGNVGSQEDRARVAYRLENDANFRRQTEELGFCAFGLFETFAATASDEELQRFADSRTIRAFLLIENALAE